MSGTRALLIALVVTAAGVTGFTAPAAADARMSYYCNDEGMWSPVAWIPIHRSATVWSADCHMGVGANSNAVRALQRTLQYCYRIALTIDGDFGGNTRKALMRAQAVEGIPADGEYGPQTRRAIKHYPVKTSGDCNRVP
ncbi:putative peptidoglycan binding protein [Saccharothrix saharensis]|uniref:Putative peptidoglycan binding protein n=1 Tax=Saccharothrix saharensis TaxID=571190 RepID=A0A543J842_9PSEU|nr:peptidoglycan-binding domain-containing protein [Saccharothrix saharensis]TQM78990.1 putative peptidoglycan binding protein [Saccharothrix saharensis]